MATATTSALPTGSFPTMITPFVGEGEHRGAIDYPIVRRLVEWYIASGCVGIFSPCLSSEMYDLSPDERLELARFVKDTIAGRCALVSTGHCGPYESAKQLADFTAKMAEHCDAVVILTCDFDPDQEGDEAWKENCRQFIDELPEGVALGLYECPVPYKRVLSPELLAWAVGTGRFLFHKDTCCDEAQMAAKLAAVRGVGEAGANFRFYNANVETIAFSTAEGGAGFSGISANFYPHLHAWLVKTMTSEDYADDEALHKQVEKVQDFFSMAELTVCVHYPASAKEYLRTCYPDFPISSFCRKFGRGDSAQPVFSRQDTIRLHALHRLQRMIATAVGIADVKP